MARTALLTLLCGAVLAGGWSTVEAGEDVRGRIALLVLVATLPALARSGALRAVAAVLAVPVGLALAFDRSLSDARPFSDRDFWGPVLADLKDGVLAFYDVTLPFDPGAQPLMHGAVLTAIFGFTLLAGLAVAARRPVLAGLVVVSGSAWPATLVPGSVNETALGAILLAVVLALLAAGGREAPRSYRPAVVAVGALVLASLAAAAQPAVAKGEFLSWQGWDFYDRPADPVGVDYVWDSTYDGIDFPEEETAVLKVRGPRRADYWRATTLDVFEGDRWVERLGVIGATAQPVRFSADPYVPRRGKDPERWVRADVEVLALADDHLPGPSMPTAYDPGTTGRLEYLEGGVAVKRGGLEREDAYTVWAFTPQPGPAQLAAVEPSSLRRNTLESRYLEVAPGADVPPFGAENREEWIRNLASNTRYAAAVGPYLPLYRRAQDVIGSPDNMYTAVVALEAWFRTSGVFTYDEQPRRQPGVPPLVGFVETTREGYCQHFSNAMALMLRYLGIPARVAVGFTRGSYDFNRREWTVTDHDAHAWVEVYFPGYGWLPFDPTPTRGQLSGGYSVSGATGALNRSTIEALLRQARGGAGAAGSASPFGFAEGAGGRDVPGDLPGEGTGGFGVARDTGASLLKLLAIVAAAVLLLIALAKEALRRGRYLTKDPRRLAGAARQELVDVALDQGVRVPRSATLGELAALLERELYVDLSGFVAAATAARFGPPEGAPEASRRAREELKAVRRLLRHRLTRVERVRGLVSVRSLGFGA